MPESEPVSEDLIQRLLEAELKRFQEANPRSLELARRAVEVMPLAVPTNVCAVSPYPLAIIEGQGAWITDADGNERVDYGNGFGVSVFGHAHPEITRAISEAAGRGTHFGTLTEPVIEWSERLCRRFDLNWVRFSASGTEATMDAIRLARAATGRTRIIKIEGAYHGSHEAALVSTNLPLDGTEGPDRLPTPRLWGEGLSQRLLEEVLVLSFNDIDGARIALRSGRIAAVIIEPVLFNVGEIHPAAGYLQELRDLCDENGSKLIFDETKTAMTVGYGGAERLFGVTPHIKTLGKGIGGGIGCGALGDTDGSTYDLIERHRVPHLGTFSGNPLVASAGVKALELMDVAAYEGLEAFGSSLRSALEQILSAYRLPAYVTGVGAKGCIVWVDEADGGRLRDFRDYKRRFNFKLGQLCWLWLLNRGVFLAPGQDEQMTFSICHADREADSLLEPLEELAWRLRAEAG